MARPKNIAKVTKALLEDPLKTTREVEAETGVSKSTVAEIKGNLDKLGHKDDRIIWICDKDLENVTLGQQILNERLKTKADDMSNKDIVSILWEGTKRYTIFKWDATDGQWGLKNFDASRVMDGFN